MKVLKARNEGEDQNSWIKQLNSFKEKLDTKKETRRESSHIVSKLSPERVKKSCLKCLKLETPEVAKKPFLLSQPSNAQLVSSCREVQNLAVEGNRDDYLFGWMPKIYLFQLPKLNKYWLGGWTSSSAPGDKKAQNGSSVGLHPVSHFVPQRLQNVIKNQKGHASYWNSEYMYSIEK